MVSWLDLLKPERDLAFGFSLRLRDSAPLRFFPENSRLRRRIRERVTASRQNPVWRWVDGTEN